MTRKIILLIIILAGSGLGNSYAKETPNIGLGVASFYSGDIYLHYIHSERSMFSMRIITFGNKTEVEGIKVENGFYNLLIDYRHYYSNAPLRPFLQFRLDNWIEYNRQEDADGELTELNHYPAVGIGFGFERRFDNNLSIMASVGMGLGFNSVDDVVNLNGPSSSLLLNYYWHL